ncbi:MAG TPA: formylglycine-generating enzyme family protein, partial [Nannocystaceae bacterium]|nr:formylglycine-generating enzyme family protein [Nannocystaceae bacterium]
GWRATRIDVELGLAAAAGNIVALLGVLEGTGGWRVFLIGLGGGAGGVALAFLALRLRRLLSKQAAMDAEEAEDAEVHAPIEAAGDGGSGDEVHPFPPVGQVEPVGAAEPLGAVEALSVAGRGRGEPLWRPGGLDDPPTGRALGVRHTALEGTRAPMRFVELTGGEFTMGSRDDDSSAYDREKPRHRVQVGRFWMAEAPVTQAQYQALMGTNPSLDKGPEVPVNNVSWEDAVRFCNALSKREGREECYREEGGGWRWDRKADGYRLPTEAEWEYACRAGTTSAYSFGDDPAALGEHAWFNENSKGDAQPVKRKRPNPWGLHDMYGNVLEWCWDWFGPYSNQPSNMPQGPGSGEFRVLRGGSFLSTARYLRSAFRYRYWPAYRVWDFGFRCVRSSPSSVDR